MLCDNCRQNQATTTVTQTINGHGRVLHLCPECANKIGYAAFFDDPFFNASDLLSGFFHSSQSKGDAAKRCPECGISLDEILKTGHLGCSSCMDHFQSELLPMIRKIHGNAVHIGKIPQNASVELKSKRQLETLEAKLKEAIETQDFEHAAELRDEINRLKA